MSQQTQNRRFDSGRWQTRLDELCKLHHVPGASLAVLHDGELHELSTGVLNRATGQPVTTDSVFETGSIAKVYTATLIMKLADEGLLDIDAPVRDILPEFTVADPEASAVITVRQLLSHTSGLTCDFNHDSGRGDDAIAKFVQAAGTVALDCKPGIAVSYSGIGYVVMGRIIEVLTGQTWDAAIRDRLATPLGMTRTATLPEDVLKFPAAMGHAGMPGTDPDPISSWDHMPRAHGPGARVITTAADLTTLARMHLDGGTTADGDRFVSTATVDRMQRQEVDTPDKWSVNSDAWGLGWSLYNWGGVRGYGHDGASIGQYAYLRVVPAAKLVIALMTNGGGARNVYTELYAEMLSELAEVTMPPAFAPPATPPQLDITAHLGVYRREGVRITISQTDGKPHLKYEFVDEMAGLADPIECELIPVSESPQGKVYAGSGAGPSFSDAYMPVVFSTLTDGTQACYIGMRCGPKVA